MSRYQNTIILILFFARVNLGLLTMRHLDEHDFAETNVPLAQYAAIQAALVEPFPLAAVLAVEGLDDETWTGAEMAWRQRLAADEKQFAVYQDELAKAQDRLARRVPPFDEDIMAWTTLLAAIATAKDPAELFNRILIGVNDVARLVRRWTRQFEHDGSLRRKAVELQKKQLGAPPIARAEPRRLVPSGIVAPQPPIAPGAKNEDDVNLEAVEWVDDADIVTDPEPVPVVPHDGYVKQAAQRPMSPFAGTLELRGGGGAGIDLPFHEAPSDHFILRTPALPKSKLPSPGAGQTIDLPESDSTTGANAATKAIPFELERVQIEGFTVRQYASLCAELALSPAGARATLLRHGLADDNARAKVADAWGRRFQQQPELRDVWAQLCAQWTRQSPKAIPNFGQTAPVDERSIAAKTTPFKGGAPRMIQTPDEPNVARAASGATMDIHAGVQAKPAVPFAADKTMELPHNEPPAQPESAATSDVVIMGFNVQQYASLCAELAVSKGQIAPVLARYRLRDESARAKLADAWAQQMTLDPALRKIWMRLCSEYRDWLLNSAKLR